MRGGSSHLAFEFGQIATAAILQFGPLEIVPDAFGGVEVRSIPGQQLQDDPPGSGANTLSGD